MSLVFVFQQGAILKMRSARDRSTALKILSVWGSARADQSNVSRKQSRCIPLLRPLLLSRSRRIRHLEDAVANAVAIGVRCRVAWQQHSIPNSLLLMLGPAP